MRKFILVFFIITACNCELTFAQDDVSTTEFNKARRLKYKKSLDSINKDLQWREIRDGLYINRKGDIGFVGKELMFEASVTIYQTIFRDGEETPLKAVVDTLTFRKLGGSGFGAYYKDKNRIYHTFATTSGSNLSYYNAADIKTFKVLNNSYATDKSHVYHMRFGLMKEADVATFKSLLYKGSYYAVDDNYYYNEQRFLRSDQLSESEMNEVISLLDKL
ncbi:DKNYY domain-containing protein [Flavobacterium beibuense]|uniref:DKNYY domain-containing protein n=1 Tax=Flavobacterium beibuense TaxID=657326 RepID=UPI000690FC2A|nr:DKNYY domain-containing protein [Flavobacterium beibuense]